MGDYGAILGIVFIGEIGGEASIIFDEDSMALLDESFSAGREKRNAVFMFFDFFGKCR